MTRISIPALLIALLCSATMLRAQSDKSFLDAFPRESGWKPEGVRTTYRPKEIARYDPSLAPTLERYGVRGVIAEDWVGPMGRVRAAVLHMVDSSAAYGAFSIERDVNAAGYGAFPFGAEGFRLGRQAAFWQGPYVVRLEGDPSAVDEWARLAASLIDGESSKPPVYNYLPIERRAEGTDKYIVSAANIDGTPWGIDSARLGFEKSAEVATATYVFNGKPVQLLVVMYPTQQVAKEYEEALAATSGRGVRYMKRDGPLLAIVDPGADSAAAEALLGNMQHEFQVTWNERRPDLNIAEVILTIFKVIGVALAVTLVAGVAFGAFRIFVKRWFPGRIFDRPQDMDVIQLKLNQSVRGIYDEPPEPPSRQPTH